jgi:hypothetical protein
MINKINFSELRKHNAEQQAKEFTKSEFWWIHEKGQAESKLLFDVRTKEIYFSEDKQTLISVANNILPEHQFWSIWDNERENCALFDSKTQFIYSAHLKETHCTVKEAELKLKNLTILSLKNWRLPTLNQLANFCSIENNPWRSSKSNCRLFQKNFWLCATGVVDTDYSSGVMLSGHQQYGQVLGINDILQSKKLKEILQNWSLESVNGIKIGRIKIYNEWLNKSHAEIVLDAEKKNWVFKSFDGKTEIISKNLMDSFKEMDYRSVRLPKLEDAQFTDIYKGIWEFWGIEESILKKEGVIARDPARDVKKFNVAIDFGTSSTVVAFDNNGRYELFRIGVKDFYEKAQAKHYENPTVLEFVNYPQFLEEWQNTAYRPATSWDDVRCSHEAQENFRNNQGKTETVSSIFPKMKQWALRQSDDIKLKIIDQINCYEFELSPLSPTNPVKGKLLAVSKDDVFDPIELYAWFLGMTINWRSLTRGIFVNYYMTFPVAYPKEVKEKILASFRRGIHRSMPETLVQQDIFHKSFQVKEIASEPAAYAASALQAIGIKPTQDGVAYGVFDFGGGTTDFDYGYYRQATAEEEDLDGTERVLEHIAAQGDKFLGGENLLENLAFRVFSHNMDALRKDKIAFTCPLDATPIAGTEMLLDKTQAAQTNMIMLMAKLRPFWETGEYNASSSGVEALNLLNNEGKTVSCTLKIPIDELNEYLSERIGKGIANFFIGMKEAFGNDLPEEIHILLAGNSSRSVWIKEFFDSNIDDNNELVDLITAIFKTDISDTFIIHQPLEAKEDDVYSPTAKTGVALGLLDLCDGGSISLVNRTKAAEENETTFNHFIGRIRQDKFQIALKRGVDYNVWHELSAVGKGGVTYLYHTQSPLALHGEMEKGDSELTQMRLDFAGDTTGHRVFIRAIAPNQIEICSAESLSALQQGVFENLQSVTIS